MTNPDFPSLTKTCASCGKQRPLSSFLQLSSDQGSLYGNICASCRKTELEKSKAKADGGSSRETGKTIDSRARVKSEADKKELIEQTREANLEEAKKDSEAHTKDSVKKEIKDKHERTHRDTLLQGRSFLSETKKKEIIRADAIEVNAEVIAEQQTEATNADYKVKTIDTTAAQSFGMGLQEKHKGRFLEFAAWIGDTPMTRNIRRSMEQAAGKTSTNENTAPENKESGPKSRGRG